ncbi:hypothetical protein KJ673_04395 [Patescibacteria group bacterium]|nr:hypothetical protein [Patescibacteria group bacterium]MBU4453035.1 hypothetical protein [Patescibacteria group bacterium]MCG2687517.1 hypothetical protein [Candidatus Parcubacteria bacterium]
MSFLFLFVLMFGLSTANAQSHHSHDRCVRYDTHHRCTQWTREPERSSRYRVQVRVGYPPPPPSAYDPYGMPAGYYDPYAQYPDQYGYGQQPYGQYYGGQPMYDPPYYGGAPYLGGQGLQTQEMLIQESETATLARQLWEADRRASEQMARSAQMSAEAQAEALRAQKARLQAELKSARGQVEATSKKLTATEAQLREAESILLMEDEPAPEGE